MRKILQRGAEAIIYLDEAQNRIIKDRVKKSYRLSELDDRIRRQRTRSELKLLEKASRIISTPKPNESSAKNSLNIEMPFINGKKLSEHLDNFPLNEQKSICRKIGESAAKLHSADIIHGDLTTSNMIYTPKKRKEIVDKKEDNKNIDTENKVGKIDLNVKNFNVFFVDFGLGFISHKIEDKAVDIHLFKEALEAKHFEHWQGLFEEFLKGYEVYSEHKKVLEQLKKVEARGRYRH